ncbi:sensor histidine kinase [Roseofilum casamattae]|uniref:histidine kinase n=1 Tax=Roseofilum casamattae BLCC-M143 TaxID=3022442 RepID=A0ABT7BTC7_9CYAN|nr:ATP-binding protein [Roseofilum casamattae]MDJ1182439.1 ATP-binding protein [Roseofilum casamattae BLCC-M143]
MSKRIQESIQDLEVNNHQLSETLQKLQSTQLQLIQHEKMSSLGQLVGGIAHEINNPISFIRGNVSHAEEYILDLLRIVEIYQVHCPPIEGEDAEEIEEIDVEFIREDFLKLLESMKVGSDRVREIVISLRNFSRLDESIFKESDIKECLQDTLAILNNKIEGDRDRQPIQIVTDYGNLPTIECYPAQLNQVFMYIINNAIDALESFRSLMSDRIPQIKIAAFAPDTDRITIAIADNGIGIPEEVKQRIFDPFFTTKPVGEGTGLGLAISYQIIAQTHQGHLECHSTLGKGTELRIQIPRHLISE